MKLKLRMKLKSGDYAILYKRNGSKIELKDVLKDAWTSGKQRE